MYSDSGESQADASGIIFNIQRFSIEDGPGIRTTVFTKGCPLRCIWCHNPEGLQIHPQLMWFDVRCIGARDCLEACPNDALELTRSGMIIDRGKCDGCGLCEKACPAGALEVVGREVTSEEAYEEVARDEVFYRNSGGGVTFSGGEPTMQPAFVSEVMRRCRENGIHVALDTCGYSSRSSLQELLGLSDMVLYDLKIMDPGRHLELTGVELEPILENLELICESGKPVWVRTPVIPGCTDSDENFMAMASFIGSLKNVERWDILAFNNTCGSKYKRLDMKWPFEGEPLIEEGRMDRLAEIAEESRVEKVAWSGVTRKGEKEKREV